MKTGARFVAWLCLWLWAGAALAGTSGNLMGHVLDDEGEPVPRAQVTLESPLLVGGKKTLTTDEQGRFRYTLLRPGRYDLVIQRPGYRAIRETKVLIEIDSHLVREYELERGYGLIEEHEFYELGVNPTRVALGRSFRPAFTDLVPTDRRAESLATLLPGGLLAHDQDTIPSIHGGNAAANQYHLDGLVVTDPLSRLGGVRIDFDTIQETQILTGALDAEYGYLTGGLVNTLTTSGTNEFVVDASVYSSPNILRATESGESDYVETMTANILSSGPIIRNKLWYNVSAVFLSAAEAQPPLAEPVFPLVPVVPSRTTRGLWLSGKLRFQPVPWETLTVFIQGDPTWSDHALQDPLRHPRAGRQLYDGGINTGLSSETRMGDNVVWTTTFGYSTNRIEISPVSNDFTTPGRLNLALGTLSDNESLIRDDNRFRLQLRSAVSVHLDDFFGSHEFKLGVEGHLVWATLQEDRTGGQVFLDNGIDETALQVPGTIPGSPYRELRVVEPLNTFVWGNTVSLFVQDIYNPFPNFTIRPGLRFDSARTYNDPLDGGRQIYNLNWPSPRLGAVWDPFGDGKTAIRGGYYQYADMGQLAIPRFVGRELAVDVYEYNPATSQYDVAIGREGGGNNVTFNQLFTPPVMHEVVLGASREIFDHASLSLDLIFRRWNGLIEDRETNVQWNQAGSAATGYANGTQEFILAVDTVPNAFNQYIGFDVTFDKRLSDRWSLLASYTYAQLQGTVEELFDYSFNNPRQAAYEYGFLRNDVRHSARLFLTYELPYGLTAGLFAQYQTGRPYSKLFFNQVYNDYVDRRAPRGYDPGDINNPNDDVELRVPDNFLVNLRLAWRLKELTTQDIWLITEVRNILDRRPATRIEERAITVGDTRFGQAIQREAPLRASVAIRYVF